MAPILRSVSNLKKIAQEIANSCCWHHTVTCLMCDAVVYARNIVDHFTAKHDQIDYRFKCFLCFQKYADFRAHFERCIQWQKLPVLTAVAGRLNTELGERFLPALCEERHVGPCLHSNDSVPSVTDPVTHISSLVLLEGDIRVRPSFQIPDYSRIFARTENFRYAIRLLTAFEPHHWYYAIVDSTDLILKEGPDRYVADFWKTYRGKTHALVRFSNPDELWLLQDPERVFAVVRDVYHMVRLLLFLSDPKEGENVHRSLQGCHALQLLFMNPISVLQDIYHNIRVDVRHAPVYHMLDNHRTETYYSKLEDVVKTMRHYNFEFKGARTSVDDAPKKGCLALTLDGKYVNIGINGPGITMVDVVKLMFPQMTKIVWNYFWLNR